MIGRPAPLSVACVSTVIALLVGGVTATDTAGAAAAPSDHEPGRCTTAHLRLTEGSSDGAEGTSYITWHLSNTGTRTCTLYGYPGFAGLDKAGHVVQHPARRNAALAGNRSKRVVTLHRHQRADFMVSSIVNVPTRGCHDTHPIARVQVYPPGATRDLRGRSREKAICNLEVGYVTKHR